MRAFAWRRETDNDSANYCVQVENIKGKQKLNKVLKTLSEWEVVGKGYNANTREYTFMFARDFASPSRWLICAKKFPIHLTEVTSHGNELVRNKKLIKQGDVL
jgi:hypothetical protein